MPLAWPGQQIRLADKGGDLARGGPRVDFLRRADLHRLAVEHHDHDIGDAQRLLLVMRDKDRRGAGALDDGAHILAQRGAQRRIEPRKGFVEQHDRWLRRQRARQRHALLLPARQLVRIAFAVAAHADQRQQFLDAARPLRVLSGKAMFCATVRWGKSAPS
jgi:hypothetical protein